MSSETSTEPQPAFEPWQLFTLAGLIGATIAVFVARGESPAGVVLISLTIFAAAVVGLAALRTFLPLAGKVTSESTQVLGGRTRAALEREKALALRAIKELEFDRAMGKVSEKDFVDMSGRLRARAARLIRQLDAGSGYRNEIEQEIARRLGESRPGEPTGGAAVAAAASEAVPADRVQCTSCGAMSEATARFCTQCGRPRCAACGVNNDPDARFCKQCGGGLGA
jgi:hypothetical protein